MTANPKYVLQKKYLFLVKQSDQTLRTPELDQWNLLRGVTMEKKSPLDYRKAS
jgi:hypothetical protein